MRILHGELLLQEAELRGEQRFDVTRRRIQADAAAVVPCYHRHADAKAATTRWMAAICFCSPNCVTPTLAKLAVALSAG